MGVDIEARGRAMKTSEIQTGQQYWIKPAADQAPKALIVWRISNPERPLFHCIDPNGRGCFVHADAFIRPVEPETVAS